METDNTEIPKLPGEKLNTWVNERETAIRMRTENEEEWIRAEDNGVIANLSEWR